MKEIQVEALLKRPSVGVALICQKEEKGNVKYLMGLRQNAHGHNTWAFPGGKLDLFEDPRLCAQRELKEETGIEVLEKDIEKLSLYTNDVFKKDNLHYITLYFKTKTRAEAKLLEPLKCKEWRWVSVQEALSLPLFEGIEEALKYLQQNK